MGIKNIGRTRVCTASACCIIRSDNNVTYKADVRAQRVTLGGMTSAPLSLSLSLALLITPRSPLLSNESEGEVKSRAARALLFKKESNQSHVTLCIYRCAGRRYTKASPRRRSSLFVN